MLKTKIFRWAALAARPQLGGAVATNPKHLPPQPCHLNNRPATDAGDAPIWGCGLGQPVDFVGGLDERGGDLSVSTAGLDLN